jgi:hypothetical protein
VCYEKKEEEEEEEEEAEEEENVEWKEKMKNEGEYEML